MSFLCKKFFVALIVSIFLFSSVVLADQSESSNDILWAEFTDTDEFNLFFDQEAEHKRLIEICGYGVRDCFLKIMAKETLPLATVYDSPKSDGKVIGTITASLKLHPHEDGGLTVGFDFNPSNSTHAIEWISDLGDFSYGLHAYIAGKDGDWIRLPKPFPESAWVNSTEFITFQGVSSIKGDASVGDPGLIYLDSAIEGISDKNIPSGVYVVESISDQHITMRPEMPSDMPCSDESDPPVKPESILIPRNRLFNASGNPIFGYAYERGC